METILKLLKQMPSTEIFFIGLAIRLIVGMRQFNRRGIGGLQHFRNYPFGLFSLLIEWILKWIAVFMMLWGMAGWLFI
jgi:hypothetical protein